MEKLLNEILGKLLNIFCQSILKHFQPQKSIKNLFKTSYSFSFEHFVILNQERISNFFPACLKQRLLLKFIVGFFQKIFYGFLQKFHKKKLSANLACLSQATPRRISSQIISGILLRNSSRNNIGHLSEYLFRKLSRDFFLKMYWRKSEGFQKSKKTQ